RRLAGLRGCRGHAAGLGAEALTALPSPAPPATSPERQRRDPPVAGAPGWWQRSPRGASIPLTRASSRNNLNMLPRQVVEVARGLSHRRSLYCLTTPRSQAGIWFAGAGR